jgi:hypothetical protein
MFRPLHMGHHQAYNINHSCWVAIKIINLVSRTKHYSVLIKFNYKQYTQILSEI